MQGGSETVICAVTPLLSPCLCIHNLLSFIEHFLLPVKLNLRVVAETIIKDLDGHFLTLIILRELSGRNPIGLPGNCNAASGCKDSDLCTEELKVKPRQIVLLVGCNLFNKTTR